MFKSLMHDMVLAVQTRTGITTSFVVWLIVVALAALTASVFLCVAAYDWLALQIGSVYAALVMAAIFAAGARARNSGTCRACACAVVAARSENSRHCRPDRPLARLAARHSAGAGRLHGGAMGARAPRARGRQRRIGRCEAKRASFFSSKVHRSAMAGHRCPGAAAPSASTFCSTNQMLENLRL
jgi:hypothetical protein